MNDVCFSGNPSRERSRQQYPMFSRTLATGILTVLGEKRLLLCMWPLSPNAAEFEGRMATNSRLGRGFVPLASLGLKSSDVTHRWKIELIINVAFSFAFTDHQQTLGNVAHPRRGVSRPNARQSWH